MGDPRPPIMKGKIQVRGAVNGHGVIGERIADAIGVQDDVELVGVTDVIIFIALLVAHWPSAEPPVR